MIHIPKPHIPKLFVQQACPGNSNAAEGLWTGKLGTLRGLSPAEAWDNPTLLVKDPPPNPSQLFLTAMRAKIISVVRTHASAYRAILTPNDVPSSSVDDLELHEEPAPPPVTVKRQRQPRRRLPFATRDLAQEFHSTPSSTPRDGNGGLQSSVHRYNPRRN